MCLYTALLEVFSSFRIKYRKFSALFRMNKSVRRHTWKWFAAVCAQGCDRCQQGWWDWEIFVNQLMSIILLTTSLYSQWLIITYLERSFSEDNAAERSRSWPQAAREDLQICLTSGMCCFFHTLDVVRLPAVVARNMHLWSMIAKSTIHPGRRW